MINGNERHVQTNKHTHIHLQKHIDNDETIFDLQNEVTS